MNDKHLLKSHNKNLLLYHLVCPAKYRRKVMTPEVEKRLKEVCEGIGERYEIYDHELGADESHVHFLVQSVPMNSPTKIIKKVKSLTSRIVFQKHPEVRRKLWGGNFWTIGYYVNTVGQYGSFETIQKYVKNQGKEYTQIYRNQLKLF